MTGTRTTDLTSSSLADDIIANVDLGAGPQTVRVPVSSLANQLSSQFNLTTTVLGVKSRTVSTPPSTPTLGDRYIVGPSPTGAWASKANQIALWNGSAWTFTVPSDGNVVLVVNEFELYGYSSADAKWKTLTSAPLAFDTYANLAVVTTAPANVEATVYSDVIAKTASRARSSNVATIVFATNHGLTTGNKVNIRSVGGTGYNATQVTVTVVNATTITYSNTGSNETTATDTSGQADRNGVYSSNGAGGWTWVGDPTLDPSTLAALSLKADLASPTFTGTPAAPTATAGSISTQIATTAFVDSAILGWANDRVITLPPAIGYQFAIVRVESNSTLSIIRGLKSDGTVTGFARSTREILMPPGTGYRNAVVSEDMKVISGFLSSGDPIVVTEQVERTFYTAADSAGVSQIFWNNRQQTFGPENKRLRGLAGLEKAVFTRDVADPRYANVTGIVSANKTARSTTNTQKIRIVIGYGQSRSIGFAGAIDATNPLMPAALGTAIAPGKILMLRDGLLFGANRSGGLNPGQNGFANWTDNGPTSNAIVDAKAQQSASPQFSNDPPAASAVLWVAEAHDWDGLYAVVAHGRGSTPLQVLSKPETAAASDFDVSYATKALLDADLNWPANKYALVTADPDTTKIGPYVKVGNSGTGSWVRQDCYRNIIAWLNQFKTLANTAYPGYALEVVYIPVSQGDANVSLGTSQADMLRLIGQLQTDLTADIKAITGQTSDPIFGFGQASANVGGQSGPAILAYLQAALDNSATRVFWGPEYVFDSYGGQAIGASDFYHLLPWGSIDYGEVMGIAYFDKVKNNTRRIFYPTAATLSGTTVTVTFNVPVGSLTINPTITDPGFFGAAFTDSNTGSTGSVSVKSAKILTSNTASFELTGVPTGTGKTMNFGYFGSGRNGTDSSCRTSLCDQAQVFTRVSGKYFPTVLAISQIAVA